MIDPIECRIARLDMYIDKAKLYAQWWMTRAITGEAAERCISRGTNDKETYPDGWKPLTREEKIKVAINTANRHIRLIEEFTESKIKLMKEKVNDRYNRER